MDSHHATSHSRALPQGLFNEQHHFPLKTRILNVPIATEGRIVKPSKPVLVVGAKIAGWKDLQRHGH